MPLEVPFPNILSGSISASVLDPQDPGTPQTIIETDDDWNVDVHWQLQGPLAPFLAGTFTLRIFAESLAASSFEGQIGATQTFNLNAAPPSTTRNYAANVVIPAGSVPTGVYKITTVLTYANLGVPLEMAGFVEGPLVQLYDKVFFSNNP